MAARREWLNGAAVVWTNDNRARYDRRGQRYPSDLTDAEWAILEPLLPVDIEGGVMIKLNKSNTITLENVTKAQLIELGSDPNHTEAFVFGSHPDVFNPFA